MNQHEIDQMQLAEHDRNAAKGPDMARPDGETRTCTCDWSGQPNWCKVGNCMIVEWCPKCKKAM